MLQCAQAVMIELPRTTELSTAKFCFEVALRAIFIFEAAFN